MNVKLLFRILLKYETESGSPDNRASAFHIQSYKKQTQFKGRQHILNGTIKKLKENQNHAKGEILPGLSAGEGTI
ncbi:hypothetical protein [Clostridium boliviensis]|uniref:hypothetical protein n=1 Tax=Clostridium boliviensis TaxID=318465 RepID=UPI002963DF25|nr:hypothetical protein [Clostridium boliviensis]